MKSFLQSDRQQQEHWIRYLAFALLTVVAILVSPEALKATSTFERIVVFAFPTFFFCYPVVWELFWGADADPKRRLGVMGMAFFLLLNLAVGMNRTPDVNRLSTTLLQAVCFGLAIQCGVMTGNQQNKAAKESGSEE